MTSRHGKVVNIANGLKCSLNLKFSSEKLAKNLCLKQEDAAFSFAGTIFYLIIANLISTSGKSIIAGLTPTAYNGRIL